jgi:hypothetical protein
MFNCHALADKAGALLFEKVERRLEALLAEQGASDPNELPRAVQGEILRRVMVETAALNFPTANLEALDHGTRSFTHPAFVPAWDRVRSLTAIARDSFAMASGVDAAVLLAGFGLSVAPFDFILGILEEPSNDIDTVIAMFSRWKNAFVGYSSCDAPFYVLLTDCVRSLRKQVLAHPGLFDVGRLFARTRGSLPPDPGSDFTPGMALFPRQPGDAISTALLMDPSRSAGSLMLDAGWRVAGQAYGAPFDGYLPFPAPLLRAVAYDPGVAYSLCSPVGAPPAIH